MRAINRVLITGASGYIGQHLLRRLSQQGVIVRGFARHPAPALPASCEWVQGDIIDPNDVRQAIKDCDAIVHLACLPLNSSRENPALAFRINGLGTLNVIQTAYEQGHIQVVYTSTAQVYEQTDQLPLTEDRPVGAACAYAASKLWGEIVCRTFARSYGLPVTILRLFNVYGLAADGSERPSVETVFIRKVIEGQAPLIKGHPEEARDFIHTDDVLHCLNLALFGPKTGRVINVGTGVLTTLNTLAWKIIELSGTSLEPIIQVDKERPKQIQADITKADHLLGFRPRISLEDGLAKMVKQLSQRK